MTNHALLVDDNGGAISDALVIQVKAKLGSDGAPGLEVGQERVGNSHLLGVGLVRPHAVDAQAEHLGGQALEALEIVDKAGMLLGTHGTPVERVKGQQDILATETAERDVLLVLVLEREIRGRLPHCDRHGWFSPLSDR